jgi:hypothetical protein
VRAEIGAVLYALGAWLVVHTVIVMCRRTPDRIPLLPWRGRPQGSGLSGYLLGGVLLLGPGVDLLSRHHYWRGFLILIAPIVLAQHLVIVRHNREVARAEPPDFAVHH